MNQLSKTIHPFIRSQRTLHVAIRFLPSPNPRAAGNTRIRKTLVRAPSARRPDVDSMNQDCSTDSANATLLPVFNRTVERK
ncbi:hypothetical protein [Paraburkholderia sp. BL27I4N3]|uniref:hypothetical protein n=1 Tax=Paraburkholderia sp. BL27I4N3 TaxID=1938805 RepID=UPI0011C483D4|nr:hypothetical protein [Paraburkholderia sp. BL27I4N3]